LWEWGRDGQGWSGEDGIGYLRCDIECNSRVVSVFNWQWLPVRGLFLDCGWNLLALDGITLTVMHSRYLD
jgi:hypothetical protein